MESFRRHDHSSSFTLTKRSITDQICKTSILYRFLLFKSNPFFVQLFYFISLSVIGFLLLKLFPFRSSRPGELDLIFTSVSATTVSSMDVVEMETFSEPQLLVLTLLMLLGGEVFTSMVGLQFQKIKLNTKHNTITDHGGRDTESAGTMKQSLDVTTPDIYHAKLVNCLRYLGFVVLGYLIVVHAAGFFFILVYLTLIPTARAVLRSKGINMHTFAIFTVVSTFTNCGFLPTNENMMVFRSCSGMLLVVGCLVLAGNTMYPPLLRSAIWAVKKITRRPEFDRILDDPGEIIAGYYDHLLPRLRVVQLAFTVGGFVAVQMVLFICMEWRSDGLDGLDPYRKIVGAFFQSVNARHAGESIVDISTVSAAVMVVCVVMMYLPPYTTFFPKEDQEDCAAMDHDNPLKDGEISSTICTPERSRRMNRRSRYVMVLEELCNLSQLSYLAIFITIICITERKHIVEDPLNFNVLNIVIEVISAYGNVGFSTGYSCKRRLVNHDGSCKDSWTGFSGRWSREGKITLIAVMFFGRLKKFSMAGGKAWKLS